MFLCTEDTSNPTIKISKDKKLIDGKPVVVPGKNSADANNDYPKESTEWVKDILMIQQAGQKAYNKNTFTSFAAMIFNHVQATMVLDHIARELAVSSPYIPFILTRLVKQLQVIILWPQNDLPSHLKKMIENGEHHNIW